MLSSALIRDKKAQINGQLCITNGSDLHDETHYNIGPTGSTGPIGPKGAAGEVAMLEVKNSYNLELKAQKNQLLLWNTVINANSIGHTEITVKNGLFTNNSGRTLPILVEYNIGLVNKHCSILDPANINVINQMETYVQLSNSSIYGDLVTLVSSYTSISNSAIFILGINESFGVYTNTESEHFETTENTKLNITVLTVGQMGPTGPIGEVGLMGPIGQTGKLGLPGRTGPRGPTGPTGSTGPTGKQGIPGRTGPIGQTGPTGSVGPFGPTGSEGQIGPTGSEGPRGPSQWISVIEDNSIQYTTGNIIVENCIARNVFTSENIFINGIQVIPELSSQWTSIDANNIYYNGNISIGQTTTPNYTLDVSGNVNVSGTLFGQTITVTSDYRIKKNPILLDESFVIDHLRPIRYTNMLSNREDLGFLAHEVQEIFPYLVYGEKDENQNQSINYNGLIAVLVKEMQEVKKTMKELALSLNK